MILKVYIHQSTSQRVSRMQNLVIKKFWPPTLRPLCRVDFQLNQKISKRRFFQDIKNSFQWVIGNGLKPTQFFSFQNISTNTVARDVQSFGRNGPWLAGWLSSDQNFCANLAQTCDEHMLKISKRYLDSYLNYC